MIDPVIEAPSGVRTEWETTRHGSLYCAAGMEICGPITAEELAEQTTFTESQVLRGLGGAGRRGVVLRGAFPEKSGEFVSGEGAS